MPRFLILTLGYPSLVLSLALLSFDCAVLFVLLVLLVKFESCLLRPGGTLSFSSS